MFVLGLSAARMPGPFRPDADSVPRRAPQGTPAGARRPRAARDRDAAPAAPGDDAGAQGPRARLGGERGARSDPPAVAVLRGGHGGRGRGGGGLRGGAVRPGGGTPLDLPDHARRAARHGGAHGRAPRRDAARHVPRRGPGGLALPRADQGGRADRAGEGGQSARRRASGGERDPAPVRHAGAARDPRAVGARQLAARHRARPSRAPGERPQRRRAVARPVHPAARPRPDAVGLGHRHLPDLPAEVQVRARLPDPAGADHPPALRHRGAPGAGALPHPGRRLARPR